MTDPTVPEVEPIAQALRMQMDRVAEAFEKAKKPKLLLRRSALVDRERPETSIAAVELLGRIHVWNVR
jgi:hypothetical protein